MTIGIGILGFAHGHVDMYCQAWREQPQLGVQVVAGWDADQGRLAKAVATHGCRPASSPAELLADPAVAAVVVASETSQHADLVELAAQAGRPIILQKPLCLTLAEADRIVQAVDQHGVPFTLAWQMRVDPENLRLRQLVAEGAVGRVLTVRRRHCLATQQWAGFADSWHVQPHLNRNMWADDAAHPTDFLYWLLGRPETVAAELTTLVNPRIPEDNGVAIFRYADGRLGEVSCSFTAIAGENTTEIVGDAGVIIQNYGDGPSTSLPRPAGASSLKWCHQGDTTWREEEIGRPHGQRIRGLAAPLAAFLQGAPALAGAREGRDVLRMILASLLAAREGRRVSLDAPELTSL